jgi:hypothetical protein
MALFSILPDGFSAFETWTTRIFVSFQPSLIFKSRISDR